jgi:hypothetical protein
MLPKVLKCMFRWDEFFGRYSEQDFVTPSRIEGSYNTKILVTSYMDGPLLDGAGQFRDVSIELVPAGAEGLGLSRVVAEGGDEGVVPVDHLGDLRVLLVQLLVQQLLRELTGQTFFLQKLK